MTSRYVILSSARSGTKYLRHLLGRCSTVLCQQELCKASNILEVGDLVGHIESVINTNNPGFYMFNAEGPDTAIGFKLMHRQLLANLELVQYFKDRDYKVIHLHRVNPIDRFYSMMNAKQTNTWHVEVEGSADNAVMDLNIKALVRYVRQSDDMRRRVMQLVEGLDCISFTYEYMVQNPIKVTEDSCKFLGVRCDILQCEFPFTPQRQRTAPIEDVVSNYKEVVSAMMELGYNDYIR